MEDLVPLIFFLVIVLVNGLKFFIEKGVRKRGKEPPKEAGQPQRQPSAIEAFFEKLAEQMAPQPPSVPDWPESRPRPDYIQEMEEFEHVLAVEDESEPEEIISRTKPHHDRINPSETTPVPGYSVLAQSPFKATSAILSGSKEIRIPGQGPFARIDASNHVEYSLKGKKNLKRAMIANIIFSPPRAYDCSFDNTIAK